jgi:hypothetical protein
VNTNLFPGQKREGGGEKRKLKQLLFFFAGCYTRIPSQTGNKKKQLKRIGKKKDLKLFVCLQPLLVYNKELAAL